MLIWYIVLTLYCILHVLTSLKENHKKDHWLVEIITFCRNTGLSEVSLKGTKNDKIKTIINNWDKELWKKELATKKSVALYATYKNEIKESTFYDKPSSVIFFKCRSNTLNLNDRNRFINKETKCIGCEEVYEDLSHFILYCSKFQKTRNSSNLFPRPYSENYLGELLFEEHIDKETVKSVIYRMWIEREKLKIANT